MLPNDDLTVSGESVNEADAATATTFVVNLPFTDKAGQAELRVVRKYKRHKEDSVHEQQSNPILITLTDE